jgi:hypothetical protein
MLQYTILNEPRSLITVTARPNFWAIPGFLQVKKECFLDQPEKNGDLFKNHIFAAVTKLYQNV